jgi:isoquinoline 1-oxidoreductase beta subunit
MIHGRCHPTTQAKMISAFDANNNLITLRMRISGQPIFSCVAP